MIGEGVRPVVEEHGAMTLLPSATGGSQVGNPHRPITHTTHTTQSLIQCQFAQCTVGRPQSTTGPWTVGGGGTSARGKRGNGNSFQSNDAGEADRYPSGEEQWEVTVTVPVVVVCGVDSSHPHTHSIAHEHTHTHSLIIHHSHSSLTPSVQQPVPPYRFKAWMGAVHPAHTVTQH
eukprot:m.128034 g.128034  ORF g.128034 m.128034 type:complete len:175 (+) comp22272_c0_seq1:31-555(+)